jgi:hypothetical protein
MRGVGCAVGLLTLALVAGIGLGLAMALWH